MTRIFLALAVALYIITPAIAQSDDHGASQLNGDWTLDLRPTNNASAYIKTMKLDITPQGVVRGDF